jgi:transketolase
LEIVPHPVIKTMKITNKDLKRRIIDISWKNKLSHIGSCLTAVDIINEIYFRKLNDEKFILSSGHAGLALYVVIEAFDGRNAEEIFKHHGVHPDRCSECDIACSTGSLGQGLPIAVGMALSDRTKNVYCLVSDGEMNEGSIYEALEVAHEQKLTNLKVYVNCNGWGAYKALNREHIGQRCAAFGNVWMAFKLTDSDEMPFLKSQDAHYYTMKEEDYRQAMEILK